MRQLDWFRRLDVVPLPATVAAPGRLEKRWTRGSMGLEDENGERYYGVDALEQMAARCPLLLPFAMLLKVPGAIYLARPIFQAARETSEEGDPPPRGGGDGLSLEGPGP